MTQPQTQNQQYKDPVISLFIDLIKANTSVFKSFYYGDPIRIPASNLPACLISKRATNIKIFTNGEDEHNMQIIFTVVADIRKDLQGDNTVTAGTSSLYDIIEGRDPVTLALKPESLAYILRHNVDLYQNLQFYVDVENPTKIDYAMTVGKRATDSWSNEGTLTLVAKLVQIR